MTLSYTKILNNSRFAITLLLSLLVPIQASADELSDLPSGNYSVDLSHASVVWKVSHLGFSNYVGRFNDFTASLTLDTQSFRKSAIDVAIKVDSIDTAYPWPEKEDFDKKLATDWFDYVNHPTIGFKSTSVSALNDNKATVTGDLTLKGVTKPATLDVIFNKAVLKHPFLNKPAVGFSATTKIDRTEWGLSNYAPQVGAEVIIEIEGEFLLEDK